MQWMSYTVVELKNFYRNVSQAFFVGVMPLFYFLIFAWANRNSARAFTFIVPGALGLMILMTMLVNQANTIAIQRSRLLLKRLRGTPLKPLTLITGKIAISLGVLILRTAVILIFTSSVFHQKFMLNWPTFILVFLVSCVIFAFLGFALANLIPNADSAVAITNVVMFVLFILSIPGFTGLHLGKILTLLSHIDPVTYLMMGLRDSYTGSPFDLSHAFQYIVVGIWVIGGVYLAVARFRWDER